MFDWLNEAQSLSSKLDEAEMEEVGLEIIWCLISRDYT
jgi:hypothetical protein